LAVKITRPRRCDVIAGIDGSCVKQQPIDEKGGWRAHTVA